MPKRTWFLFGLLLVLGTSLRFHGLERQSLWDDEMSTRKDVYMPLSLWPALFRSTETHPPLHFLQLKGWCVLFGDSLRAQRANSAAWGSLALILMFLLMRRWEGDMAGLGAMALLTLSPYHLAYSQEMRPYAMATTLALLGFWLLNRKSTATLLYVFTAELYTHYWGAFVVMAQVLSGFLYSEEKEQKKRILISAVGAIGLFGLWIPVLQGQLYYIHGLSFWVEPASPANLLKTLIAFTGQYFHHASFAFLAHGPRVWLWFVGGLTGILAIRGIRNGPRVAVIWLVVGLGVPYLLSYAVNGIYVWYRYPILIYPAFLFLVVSGCHFLPQKSLRWFAMGVLLLSSATSCYVYKTTWQKANPKAVVTFVQSLNQPDTLVIRPDYFAPLFAYYDEGKMAVIDQHKLAGGAQRPLLKGKHLILIAFDIPSDPVREALFNEYTVTSSHYFPAYAHLGITVYQLGPKRN